MRGLYAIVSPPDNLVALLEELALSNDCLAIRVDSDGLTGVVAIEVDPLGEIRADGVTIADHRAAEGHD